MSDGNAASDLLLRMSSELAGILRDYVMKDRIEPVDAVNIASALYAQVLTDFSNTPTAELVANEAHRLAHNIRHIRKECGCYAEEKAEKKRRPDLRLVTPEGNA